MKTFRYVATDEQGKKISGLIRCENEEMVVEFLREANAIPRKITRAHTFDFGHNVMPLLMGGLFILFTIGFLMSAYSIEIRKLKTYRQLLTHGITTNGIVTEEFYHKTSKGGEYWDYSYEFTDHHGTTQTGRIEDSVGSTTRKNVYGKKEFGMRPIKGMDLTVTYLPNDPTTHVPFVMTEERTKKPYKSMLGATLSGSIVFIFLFFFYRIYFQQRRRRQEQFREATGG